MKYFANFVNWLPIQVRKANFDVNENVFYLEFGR